jgi:uncharacterized protein YgiM (DUF1202 family)
VTVLQGEKLTLLEEDPGDGWVKIMTQGGTIGFVPSTYLYICDTYATPSFQPKLMRR